MSSTPGKRRDDLTQQKTWKWARVPGSIFLLLTAVASVAAISEAVERPTFYFILAAVGLLFLVGFLIVKILESRPRVRWIIATSCLALIIVGAIGVRDWNTNVAVKELVAHKRLEGKDWTPDEFALVVVFNFKGKDSENFRIADAIVNELQSTRFPSRLIRAVRVGRDIDEHTTIDELSALMREYDCFALVYGNYGLTSSSVQIRMNVVVSAVKEVKGTTVTLSTIHEAVTPTLARSAFEAFDAQPLIARAVSLDLLVASTRNMMSIHKYEEVIALSKLFQELVAVHDAKLKNTIVLRKPHPGELIVLRALTEACYLTGEYETGRMSAKELIAKDPQGDSGHDARIYLALCDLQTDRYYAGFDGLRSLFRETTTAGKAASLSDLIENEDSALSIRMANDRMILVIEEGRAPVLLVRQKATNKIVGMRFDNVRDPLKRPHDLFRQLKEELYQLVVEIAESIPVPKADEGCYVSIRMPFHFPPDADDEKLRGELLVPTTGPPGP